MVSKEYCPKCNKDVKVSEKIFHVLICNECNTIVKEGTRGISKVGR